LSGNRGLMPALDSAAALLPRVAAEVRAIPPRQLLDDLWRGFGERGLIVLACAVAFRVLLAVVPLLLFVLGLVGFLGLGELWVTEAAPAIRPHLSVAAFSMVDGTVSQVLTQGRGFWMTAGAAIAIWQVSGAIRVVMRALNEVYGATEERTLWRQIAVSSALSVVVMLLLLVALASVQFGGGAIRAVIGSGGLAGFIAIVLPWLVALALLFLAVGLLLRVGPDKKRPLHWVTFGATLVVGTWVVSSLAFGLYLTRVADYGSVFGNLASVFILLEYFLLSAMALMAGVLVDSLTRERIED
jgi:membrane protein